MSTDRTPAEAQLLWAKRLSLARVVCPMNRIEQLNVPTGGLTLDDGRLLLLARVDRGRLRCAGLDLAPGDSLLAPAGPCRVDCSRTACITIVRFRLELAHAIDALAGLRPPWRLPPDAAGLSAAAWDDLLASRRALDVGDVWMRVRGRGLVLALLGLLLRSGCAAGTVALDAHRHPAWLRSALDLAGRRLGASRLSVADLAANARLSPSHFAHRFRDLMGQSPLQWLLAERIRLACGLLSDQPELGVKGVAKACGFRDPSHFSQQFRQRTGCAPGAWRLRHPPTALDPLPGVVSRS